MAGRFPLYLDADIHGPVVEPVVEGLLRAGWDVVRAVDRYPQGTDDLVHFERAARDGRVVVSNDSDIRVIAEGWLAGGRSFRGLVWWPRRQYARMSAGDILTFFEDLALREDPFAEYPIIFVRPA